VCVCVCVCVCAAEIEGSSSSASCLQEQRSSLISAPVESDYNQPERGNTTNQSVCERGRERERKRGG